MIDSLKNNLKDKVELLKKISRITIGTTLAVNTIIQQKEDSVGLLLTAGPGLNPARFAIGNYVNIVSGGLDHRGEEVSSLSTESIPNIVIEWEKKNVKAIAIVGKFSPRNPTHENLIGENVQKSSSLPITFGHKLSGKLNFPRRIATAYYNAAVMRIHNDFVNAIQNSLKNININAQINLLKADGGAVLIEESKKEPVQSILSGPAASVMGIMSLCSEVSDGCSILMDIGGTTTDIAVFVDGSPVIDRDGMILKGRRTLVRSIYSSSIGIGGDSLIRVIDGEISVGPLREGPAMAFNGMYPTLFDALNVLDSEDSLIDRGNIDKSIDGIKNLADKYGFDCKEFAKNVVNIAINKIYIAVNELLENINSQPIYTLAALRKIKNISPKRIFLVGGPANCISKYIKDKFSLEIIIPQYASVANAIGAAVTLPTYSIDAYADTGKMLFSVPSLDIQRKISSNCSLSNIENMVKEVLSKHLLDNGIGDNNLEIIESEMFATLDGRGYGAKDMRVTCQIVPSISGKVC